MAAVGHPGEDACLHDAVRAASEAAVALGLAIPVGKDSMSMRTMWDGKAVVAPVTLVVTAFGPVNDVRRVVTPELRGAGHELLLIDLGGGRNRLGGSALAQVYGQLGETPPDIRSTSRRGSRSSTMRSRSWSRRGQAFRRVSRSLRRWGSWSRCSGDAVRVGARRRARCLGRRAPDPFRRAVRGGARRDHRYGRRGGPLARAQ